MSKYQEEIDRIARGIPDWDTHWKAYHEKHPDEPMPEVMKKASFTRRMWVAKQVKALVKQMFDDIVTEQESVDVSG